jgi:uncharacterized protein YndB with AHSA1/START domain
VTSSTPTHPKEEAAMKGQPIIIDQNLNAPAERVWKAITDKDEMKLWYFDIGEFKPEVGFEFRFLGGTEEKKYLHICKITELVSGKKITYSWRYDTYEGMSHVTFELFKEGNQTRLRLTHKGIETFPQDDPNFARGSFSKGWTYLIGTALKRFVELMG